MGRINCFYVFQVLVLLYTCEQTTKRPVFALESFAASGERVGVDCKCTIVLAPFAWFLYYANIFNIIILFLLSFGWKEAREYM